MAQPTPYSRATDFTDRDGADTNHAALNAEFDAAELTLDQLCHNLALIQQDDGSLRQGIVGANALAPSAFERVLGSVNEAVLSADSAANAAMQEAAAAKQSAGNAATQAGAAASHAAAASVSAANAQQSATDAAQSVSTAGGIAEQVARDVVAPVVSQVEQARTAAQQAQQAAQQAANSAAGALTGSEAAAVYAPLRLPVFAKQNSDNLGGGIRLQAADNQRLGDVSIDYSDVDGHIRFFAAPSGGGYYGAFINLSRTGPDQWPDLLPPAGSILITAAGGPPAGYLHANGAAVSRTAYAALFAAIGAFFGQGDGYSTFNLPDLRGEFIRGWDDGRGVDPWRVFGSSQGGQNQWHQHHGTTSAGGEHAHAVSIPSKPNGTGSGPIGLVDGAWNITGYQTYYTNSTGNHDHTFTTSADGGNETRPRNVALLMCIKY